MIRARSVTTLVAIILCVSLAAGWIVQALVARGRTPLESARELASTGRLDAAERAYLDMAAQRPGDLKLVVELIDNHVRFVRWSEHAPAFGAREDGPLSPPVDDKRIDAVVSSPALSEDDGRLARWWRHYAAEEEVADERAQVGMMADRAPPAAWANHLLARALVIEGEGAHAADRFAREASSFPDRTEDAAEAYLLWMREGDVDRFTTALGEPRFAQQVPAGVRLEDAIRRRDWRDAGRWFFPAQYERMTLGVLFLAALSALVWFSICAVIGRIGERPAARVPLYVAAFALGVGSTYLTLAAGIFEEGAFHFVEKGQGAADIIYFVFGVGLREELSKGLAFAVLLPVLKRFFTRREALACGALVGLGFAAEENLGYFHLGLSTALARFLTANFLHLSTTGIVAVALDDAARGRHDDTTGWAQTLPLVVVTHGVYDFFLSSPSVTGASFVSMFVFVLLGRRFVDVIRSLPGREGPLLRLFLVGLAVVSGGTFVYAAALVGVAHAATSIAFGMLGVAIVAYAFGRELASL